MMGQQQAQKDLFSYSGDLEDITCQACLQGLYYHHREIRGAGQAEGGARVEETALRRSEAPLPARCRPPGRRPDPEDVAELLAAGNRSVPLPLKLQICGMLDVPEERNSNRGVLCWLS